MNDLVKVNNNQVVTDSLKVAEVFEKQHKHVIEAIENMKAENSALIKMFYEDTYKVDGNRKSYKRYIMTRDGFSLLVMGFTGSKALEWKLKYIEAFNAMEKELATPKLSPNPHYRSRMLKTAVKDCAETADIIVKYFGVKPGMAQAAAMQMVGTAYGIDTEPLRGLIPAEEKPSYLTPTALAEKIGLLTQKGKPDPAGVNRKLAELGLQEKTPKGWQLTTKGKEYGECVPYSRNGHSGYQIQWGPEVVEVLKEAQ